MHLSTWPPSRALAFARGLYHVAACDGMDPREARLIDDFIARAGLNIDLAGLAAEPFDYAQAAEALDSTWLRRTFIQACRMMVQVDGVISDPERDALRAIGAALGVGQQVALEPTAAAPASLVEWVASRAIDYVSWDDDSQPGFFWLFPHAQPFSEEARILVSRGQAAIFHLDGEVAEMVPEGDHRLRPDAFPGLAERAAWQGGPVRAGLTYVSTVASEPLRWGTAEPIRVPDKDRGEVQVRAFGRFSVRITDPVRAFLRFARKELPTTADFQLRVRRIVGGRFAEALVQAAREKSTLTELTRNLDALTQVVRPHLERTLGETGLALRRFDLENVTTPMDLELRTTSSLRTAPPTRTGEVNARELIGPCPKCISPNPSAARFCGHCGTPLRRPCPTCGADLSTRARFCSDCGTQQQS